MRDLSSIVGLQVIATDEGRRLGSVSRAIVDLAAGALVAVVLGEPPEQNAILADDVEVIGQDALMVSGADKIKPWAELQEQVPGGADVLGSPPMVVTDEGTSLGHVAAVHFNPGTKKITRYEVTGGALRDVMEGLVSLPVLKGTVHGKDTIVIPHKAAQKQLAKVRGGLKGYLDKLGRVFRSQYERASERSEQIYEEGGERLKARAAQAREAAGKLSEDARRKLQELQEKGREEDAEDDEAE